MQQNLKILIPITSNLQKYCKYFIAHMEGKEGGFFGKVKIGTFNKIIRRWKVQIDKNYFVYHNQTIGWMHMPSFSKLYTPASFSVRRGIILYPSLIRFGSFIHSFAHTHERTHIHTQAHTFNFYNHPFQAITQVAYNSKTIKEIKLIKTSKINMYSSWDN